MDCYGLVSKDGLVAAVGEEASGIRGETLEEGLKNGDCAICCHRGGLIVCSGSRELQMLALKVELLAHVLFRWLVSSRSKKVDGTHHHGLHGAMRYKVSLCPCLSVRVLCCVRLDCS